MNVVDELRRRLAVLDPVSIDIADESSRHAGHAGAASGGHYRLVIESPRFAGLGTMARHRLVYAAVGDLMSHGIHALSIVARSPAEH